MPDFIRLVSEMSDDKFAEVIQASPRKIRETLFNRLGIKAKKKTVGLKLHGKLEERTRKLHARLREAGSQQEAELCEELLRNWLYNKRDLLCDTLDYLEVKHDNGLIDEEPSFFQELEREKVDAMIGHLQQKGHHVEEIKVYLTFVETAHLDDALAAVS